MRPAGRIALSAERVATSTQQPVARPRTALVVDDEAIVRLTAVYMFEDLGFEVLEAEDAEKALAVLEQRPDVALLFTDCRMPGMSGPELARIAAERFPHLRVVLVSGYADPGSRGEWPLVSKPYDTAELERIIARELGT